MIEQPLGLESWTYPASSVDTDVISKCSARRSVFKVLIENPEMVVSFGLAGKLARLVG